MNFSSNQIKKNTSSSFLPICLLIFSVICLFISAIMKKQGIFHNDQAMWDFPFHYNFANYLRKGIIPLWYPHIWAGANVGHYALCVWGNTNYYPIVWPFYFLANLKNLDQSYWMITLLPLMLHYILAAIGMFILLKKNVKCNDFAAFVGAFSYVYSPMAIYGQIAMETLIAYAWIPWLIFIYINIVEQEKLRIWKLFSGGIVLALIWFGTRPLIMPFVMVTWIGFMVLLMIKKKLFIKPLIVLLLIFIIATCLCAIKIIPIFEGFQSTKLHMSLNYNAEKHDFWGMIKLPYLATLFFPNIFGNITGNNFYYNRLMFWDANLSGGIATTFSVIIAVIFPLILLNKNSLKKTFYQYAILGICFYIFSILCALGNNTPFYHLFIGWIPIVGGLPAPIRFHMVQCFATSMLISIGIHSICNFPISRGSIRTLTIGYLLCSFIVIVLILFILPSKDFVWRMHDNFRSERKLSWVGKSPLAYNEFTFFKNGPTGLYTPKTAKVKKIRIMFNGESKGEIRYSSSHKISPKKGVFVADYYAPDKGWHIFNVNIPPNKFLWILPKTIDNGIGYWEAPGESFNYIKNNWFLEIGLRAVGFRLDYGDKNSSLFNAIRKGYILPRPIISSLLFWVILSVITLIGLFALPQKKFGYLLGLLILIEFFIYGSMAFYHGKYDNEVSRIFSPSNVRATRPLNSQTLYRMYKEVPLLTPNPTLRITTDYPMQEIYSLLNNSYALMGYGNYPIETRFKKAIQQAYHHAITYSLNNIMTRPKYDEFLSNFSVGYFLSRNFYKVFSNETYKQINGDPNFYIHTNKEVLPRVYTQDMVIAASEKEQLDNLVSDDLRKAVYVNAYDDLNQNKKNSDDYVRHFNELQKINTIDELDLKNPNQIKISVDVKIPAMLVLTEIWYPGWVANIDGTKSKIFRVNYCQRGIWVEKGRHKVVLSFKPLSWRIGAMITILSLGLTCIVLIFSVIRSGKNKLLNNNFTLKP